MNEADQKMQVTVAYNHFGKGLVQRMPRIRWGFVHVVNNDYTHWELYAIGGSQGPTILSHGNRFIAPPHLPYYKEVTEKQKKKKTIDNNSCKLMKKKLINVGDKEGLCFGRRVETLEMEI